MEVRIQSILLSPPSTSLFSATLESRCLQTMSNKKVLVCALLYRHFKRDKKRRYCVHPILSDRLSSGIFHTLHSKLKEHPDKFFKYYRMSEETLNEIISFVGPSIKRQDTRFRCAISVEERVSVTLR